jgi:hypothetical protein
LSACLSCVACRHRCVDSAGGVRYSRARGAPSGQQIRGSAGFCVCGGRAECSVSNPIESIEYRRR